MDPLGLPRDGGLTTSAASAVDREFEVAVRRLADDLSPGLDASIRIGTGTEYLQSRPFLEGDPIRAIDWRVTARTRRYHLKEHELERRVPCYLLLDTSRSMAFSSRPFGKRHLALLIAGGLGLGALKRQSPVGLLLGGDRKLHVPPSLSRASLFQWLHLLRRRHFDERMSLEAPLDEAGSLLRCRGLIAVVSDLHDPGIVPALRRLHQRHDALVIQVEDPAERGRLRGGFFRGSEAETGRRFAAGGLSRWWRGSRERPARELRAAGIDHLLLPTDLPFVTPLKRFLRERGARLGKTR